jgi:hypothetical protein
MHRRLRGGSRRCVVRSTAATTEAAKKQERRKAYTQIPLRFKFFNFHQGSAASSEQRSPCEAGHLFGEVNPLRWQLTASWHWHWQLRQHQH